MSSFSTGTGDATAARVRTELKIFTDWLHANSQDGKGLVGEYGWPGSSQALTDPNNAAVYDPGWEAVAQQWYLDANAANLMLTNWLACEWNVDLRSYETNDGTNKQFNYRTTVSSILEANYASGGSGVLRGVNIAGADFSDYGPNGIVVIGSTAQPGASYFYTLDINIQELSLRGVTFLRLPVRAERVQRTLKGALSTPDMNQIKRICQTAALYGITVMVDFHNYARYDTIGTGASGGVYDVGQNAPAMHNGVSVGGSMHDCWMDLYTKFSTAMKGVSGYWGIDIMNEPHDVTGNVAYWQSFCRDAVETIRLVDQNCFIAVPGYTYDTVPGWLSENGPNAWLTETIPAGQTGAGSARNTDSKIRWQGHHYYDNAHSGTYSNTYASELSMSTSQGYTSYSNSGYTAPSTGNTYQSGLRTVFNSSLDSAGDFSGTYDFVPSTTNATVTLPYTQIGNPGNSMRVVVSPTGGDAGGVRKSLNSKVYRIHGVDFMVPTGTTISSTNNSAIGHFWKDNNSTDFFERAVLGSGSGFLIGLRIPSGSYTFVNTGNTVLSKDVWYTPVLTVTDSATTLSIMRGSTVVSSNEASLNMTNTNTNIGGFFEGSYYGTGIVGPIYFDNITCSLQANYYAPPSGGYLAPITLPPTGATNKGLLGFF